MDDLRFGLADVVVGWCFVVSRMLVVWVFGFCGLLSGGLEFWWWVFGDCLVCIWPVDLRDLFMIWVW